MADPRYTWDAARKQFRYASTGRLVPRTLVRNAIDTALEHQRARARQLWRAMGEGRATGLEWEQAMRRLVKDTHLYTTAAAKGGWTQLTQADFGRVGGRVAREYAHLRAFREGLAAGTRKLDGRGLLDAESYAQAARRTYHDAEKDVQAEGGKTLVRNVLHPADHCEECAALADAGPMPIDEMPSPGDRQCLSNCKCELEYVEG